MAVRPDTDQQVGQFTWIRVGKHVFVSRVMRVVVDVTDDDSERVGAADWWIAAVPDDHRNVIFFALFAVKRLEAGDYTRPITVVTATCIVTLLLHGVA